MATITLDNGIDPALGLPDIGSLLWADEHGWQDVLQSVTYAFGGACIVQESAPKQAGQPMTLLGGGSDTMPWALMAQSGLDAVIALLAPAGSRHTVTLADGRRYTVTARRDQGPAVQSTPLSNVADSPLVERDDDTLHRLEAVRLLILDGPL